MNFNLQNYPGDVEFRAEGLKIEWSAGGTADGAELDERLRASLYSRLISTAVKKKELDSLLKAVENAGFSKEEKETLLLKIGARIVEKRSNSRKRRLPFRLLGRSFSKEASA